MNCRHLNEKTLMKIEQVLEGPKEVNAATEATHFAAQYGPGTLVNDWYERRHRANEETQPTAPEPLMTENMDKFRKPCLMVSPDRQDYFVKLFDSYGYGQELLMDHLGFSYYGNYVTTYDLCFNHLPKGICGPAPRRYFKGHYKPEQDLTLIYGNLTQWGLKENVIKSSEPEPICDTLFTSETSAEFVKHDLATVKKLNDFKTFKKAKAVY